MAALELAGVTACYDTLAALRDVDLTVEAGEMTAVLGRNGAGKSTLVAVVAGLHPAATGTVRIAGVDASRDVREARRHLGVAGQHIGLYPTETIGENLRIFGALGGLHRSLLDARVAELAAAFGLAEILGRRADRCSTGQRRRAHVGAALLHRPAVLLLDEPAAHLDSIGRQELQAVVQQAAADGAAVCWCTNDADEAAHVATTVAVLDRGRLLVRGSPSELAHRLATPAVEVGFAAAPPPVAPGDGIEVAGRVVRLAVSSPESAVVEALAKLGEHVRDVRSLRVVMPDLAAALAAVTRRAVPAATGGSAVVEVEANE